MADIIPWIATVATIIAASMTAANLGARITGAGFCVFLIGSLAWIASGLMTDQPALLWTNIVLTVLNIFGIWRWLGRQAEVEKGGRQASRASRQAEGETLFPVSLLTQATVTNGGTDLGRCVDAMCGCDSGRVSYVVVSEGGVGGIGETLRRLDWTHVTGSGEQLRTALSPAQFAELEELQRDQWPAR